MLDIIKTYIRMKDTEKDLKNPNTQLGVLIDFIREVFLKAGVEQAFIFGGFIRDIYNYGSWDKVRSEMFWSRKDMDISTSLKDKAKFTRYIKNNRPDIVINFEDKYRMNFTILKNESLNFDIIIDLTTLNWDDCHIDICGISYDLINRKMPIRGFKYNYRLFPKKYLKLNSNIYKSETSDIEDTFGQEVLDLFYFSEKYNIPFNSFLLKQLNILNSIYYFDKSLLINYKISRIIFNKRRLKSLLDNRNKILGFLNTFKLYNIYEFFKNIYLILDNSKISDAPILLNQDFTFITKNNYFGSDYDFINICHSEDYINSICFFISCRGIIGNSLEIGYHDGKDWNSNIVHFNPDKEKIKFKYIKKTSSFIIYKNEDIIFEKNNLFENKDLILFNKDIKRDNSYGCLLEQIK